MKDIKSREDVIIDKEDIYNNIDVKGNVESKYDIKAENFNIKGDVNAGSDIFVKNIINIKGKIKANKIFTGIFDMHGKVDADYIEAREIKIISSRNSRVTKISGQNIVVKNGTNIKENEVFMNAILKTLKINLEYKANQNSSIFEIDKIEGEYIEVTNIKVNEIIGDTVVLNECCDINKVLYSKELKINGDSKVNFQEKR